MCALVDIQMPIKKGSIVRGDVIGAFLTQTIGWEIYINLQNESDFPIDEEVLRLTAESPEDTGGIKERIQIARKRNALIDKGQSPYVYFADSDVLLNDDWNSPDYDNVFAELVMGLERHPRLGTVGLPYQQAGYHVGAGSMMLRRNDLLQIEEIRGVGAFCTCGYITHRLLHAGLYTIALRTRAKHVKVFNSNNAGIKQSGMPRTPFNIFLPVGARIEDGIYHLPKDEMMDLLKGMIDRGRGNNDITKADMANLSNYEITFQPEP